MAKKFYRLLFTVLFIFGCAKTQQSRDILFQVSTMNALLEGSYGGFVSYGEIKKHGNFGIGTFDALDGEMVELNGRIYQVKSDGLAYPVKPKMKAPFAMVTFFEPDCSAKISQILNSQQMQVCLDQMTPNKNIFYAIKIDGLFDYIKIRSVPKQDKPYPGLYKALEHQTVFELNNVKGAIVGFLIPEGAEETNIPGYHFHFVTKDGRRGGHVLDYRIKDVTISVDSTDGYYIRQRQ
jgi:acetolactate decarboxylase